ncbi:MAG TPA: hypothetical protein VFW27_27930 [Actinoplanes sp.]|nr:hypothetical protein [Actinoplanes sp.]
MTADRDREPVPVGRYAILAGLAVLILLGITLLVRPAILSLAPERNDARYPLFSIAEADVGPQLKEIVLNDRHEFPGEVVRDERVGYTVVVAPLPGQSGYSVVGAWSPTGDCPLEISGDRLRDCDGATWTFEGFPIDPDGPSLLAFPVAVRNGAVVADFTAPFDPAAS